MPTSDVSDSSLYTSRAFAATTSRSLTPSIGESDVVPVPRLVANAKELELVFRLRYRVFAEEKSYYPPNQEMRIFDELDFEDTTYNFVLEYDGCIVGGVRYVEFTGPETPIDSFFDFGPHLPLCDAKLVCGQMLWVLPEWRTMPWAVVSLINCYHDHAIANGKTHIISAVSPDAESAISRCGYRAIVPRFFHHEKALWVTPMILELASFSRLVPRQRTRGAEHANTQSRQRLWATYLSATSQ